MQSNRKYQSEDLSRDEVKAHFEQCEKSSEEPKEDKQGVLETKQRGQWRYIYNPDLGVVKTTTIDRKKKPIY